MTTLPSRLPLIQAPMVGSLAARDRGVRSRRAGSLACAALGPQQLRDEIAAIRARTSAPFNVNFFCHTPPAPTPKSRHTGVRRSPVITRKPVSIRPT